MTLSAHLNLLLISCALFLWFSVWFHLCFIHLASVSKAWDIASALKRISGLYMSDMYMCVCASERVHVCHGVHVEVRGHSQVLVFTLYLVWGRVSSPYGIYQAHQPWISRDSCVSNSHIAESIVLCCWLWVLGIQPQALTIELFPLSLLSSPSSDF